MTTQEEISPSAFLGANPTCEQDSYTGIKGRRKACGYLLRGLIGQIPTFAKEFLFDSFHFSLLTSDH